LGTSSISGIGDVVAVSVLDNPKQLCRVLLGILKYPSKDFGYCPAKSGNFPILIPGTRGSVGALGAEYLTDTPTLGKFPILNRKNWHFGARQLF
jgi:hypothetical protein